MSEWAPPLSGHIGHRGRTVTNSTEGTARRRWPLRRWIRLGFVLWAVFAMSWLANSVRTRGVDEDTLRGNQDLSVLSDATGLTFLPASTDRRTGLVFICGSGVAAEAYAPLLRPVAEAGFPVSVVRLPYRFAPLESHKRQALSRAPSGHRGPSRSDELGHRRPLTRRRPGGPNGAFRCTVRLRAGTDRDDTSKGRRLVVP